MTYCVGLDLGTEGGDWTAISVLEHFADTDDGKPRFVIRWIERWRDLRPREAIREVAQTLSRPPLLYSADIAIDARGVGWYMADELSRLELGTVRRIMSTAGAEETTKTSEKGVISYNVPKDRLVHSAAMPYQEGRLLIARGCPFKEEFRREIESFATKFSRKPGYEKMEAISGEHDDIISSVCNATWWLTRSKTTTLDESFAFTYEDLTDSEIFSDRWDEDFSRWSLNR